jgi:hypothetical protein
LKARPAGAKAKTYFRVREDGVDAAAEQVAQETWLAALEGRRF